MKLNRYIVYWDAIEKEFTAVKVKHEDTLPQPFTRFDEVLIWSDGIRTLVLIEVEDQGTEEKTELLGKSLAIDAAYKLFSKWCVDTVYNMEYPKWRAHQRALGKNNED